MLIAATVVLGILLIAGMIGYSGIRRDKWYKDKINRSRYPFESDVLSENQSKEMDKLIAEFQSKISSPHKTRAPGSGNPAPSDRSNGR